MNFTKPQLFTARLGFIEKVSSKVYLERFDLIEPKEIIFSAGQTVMVRVAPGINRSMSIASPPREKFSITLVHDVSPMGPYSKWALGAKVGDSMTLVGPLGIFGFNKESKRKKICIATGSGIAPFHSMIFDGSFDVSLYWGLRHEEDIFWKDEFETIAKQNPSFHFVFTLSQPKETWVGMRGRVGDHVFVDEKNLKDNDFYLCGSREMVKEMEGRLLAAGVPKEQIKKELFY